MFTLVRTPYTCTTAIFSGTISSQVFPISGAPASEETTLTSFFPFQNFHNSQDEFLMRREASIGGKRVRDRDLGEQPVRNMSDFPGSPRETEFKEKSVKHNI